MSTHKPHTNKLSPNPGRIGATGRSQRILAAARMLFLERGYADTSLNEIIRLAGGSKATIIEQFTNKAGLFAAVIESSATGLAEQLTPARKNADPVTVLRQYGETILRFYLSPEALLAYRGVIAEGENNPDIAQAFYQRGHEHIVVPIARQLREWHEAGLLRPVDHHDEADRFTHMLRNGLYEQRLLGLRKRATTVEIQRQVASTVDTFLGGLHA